MTTTTTTTTTTAAAATARKSFRRRPSLLLPRRHSFSSRPCLALPCHAPGHAPPAVPDASWSGRGRGQNGPPAVDPLRRSQPFSCVRESFPRRRYQSRRSCNRPPVRPPPPVHVPCERERLWCRSSQRPAASSSQASCRRDRGDGSNVINHSRANISSAPMFRGRTNQKRRTQKKPKKKVGTRNASPRLSPRYFFYRRGLVPPPPSLLSSFLFPVARSDQSTTRIPRPQDAPRRGPAAKKNTPAPFFAGASCGALCGRRGESQRAQRPRKRKRSGTLS